MPFIKRPNTHQLHWEQLVLLGSGGLEELDDKIEGTLEKIQDNQSARLNTTVKIDGSPALFCYHTYPGYPNDGIALKGFVNGPQNVMTSREEIDQKYPSEDRAGMRQMLYAGLELAKCIPDGECWQGDCLFTSSSKKEENIQGKDYITFQPNKIIYAFSEDQPGYEEVKNADFGICFHTIYKGEDYSQSFKCDPTRLNNVPSNFYIMSPALNVKSESFDTSKIKAHVDRLNKLENQLSSNEGYVPLISNEIFMGYWNTFENSSLADKKQTTINENTFINELKEYVSNKVQKDIDKLKTDKGKARAQQKLDALQGLIDNNKQVLTLLVKTLNEAAIIKMLLWEGFRQSKPDYDTYYKSKTKGYFNADMEGIAVSDQDGNIVKIVDRSSFSSYNRDPDIESGWEHNESLDENYESMLSSGEPIMAINFGRMSVPTIGHLRLVKYMASLSKGVKARLYLSHTQLDAKNPLSYESKLAWCKKAFEPLIDVVEAESPNPVKTLSDISLEEGYQGNLIYCCGKDREASARKWAQQRDNDGNVLYVDKQGQLIFKFKDFDVMVIDRIENGSDEEAVSGTMVRQCVIDDDFDRFLELVPFDEGDAEDLFEEIRDFYKDNGMLSEELITEAKFENTEITKHNFAYLDGVVKDILDNNDIRLGANGESTAKANINKDTFLSDIEKIKKLPSYSEMVSEFNRITGLKWNNIYKGTYSGHTSGQSAGEEAEALVCDIYNKSLDEASEKWSNWAQKIASFIDKLWPNEEYVATHVDGRDNNEEFYKQEAKLFKSKQDISKLLGFDASNLYLRGKDNWNKADIVLFKRGFDLIKTLRGKVNTVDEFNSALNSIILDKKVIPISLKDISPNKEPQATLEGTAEKSEDHESASSVSVILPRIITGDDYSGSLYLVDNLGRIVQFRSQTKDSDNLSVENHLSKQARGGKSITKLRQSLGLSGKDWYKQWFTSSKEMLSKMKSIFDNIKGNEPSHPSDNKIPWYNRTCFRGLIHLFENFKKNNPDSDGVDFFNWIYNTGSGSDTGSLFYLIH